MNMKITDLSSKETTIYLFQSDLILHEMILDKIENEFDTLKHTELLDLMNILQNLTDSIQKRIKPIGVIETFKNYKR